MYSCGRLFKYLSVLTVLFIVLEIAILVLYKGSYFTDSRLALKHMEIPWGILPGILQFVGAQLLIHLIFILGIAVITLAVGKALKLPMQKIETLGISYCVLGFATILLANKVFFVGSRNSIVIFGFLPLMLAKILFYLLAVIWIISLIISVYALIKNKYAYLFSVFSLMAGLFLGFHYLTQSKPYSVASAKQPNIIIIGVDSLRPDFLGYFGYEKISPNFDNFLNHSAVFAQSLTPIARTFPSWVSIFSGLYPKKNGVRTNLYDQHQMQYDNMLPLILKEKGYEAIFAMDESRFSNIDNRFGFDQEIIPPIGFNDFLLGTLNDFPLSNLIINTKLGKWLFPYSYANRPVYTTYDPDTFLKKLKPVLMQPHNKPVFLITHFCLPHFPYVWKNIELKNLNRHHYQNAVMRVDQQFSSFMKLLKAGGLLDHSIVFLISDHGEAIELPGDRMTNPELFIPGSDNQLKIISHFYPSNSENERVNQSGGHGTDVLSMAQYHTVFAVRTFGLPAVKVRAIPDVVSLLDIKPTILNYLQIPHESLSGHSLWDVIIGKQDHPKSYANFFIESDFSPAAVRTMHPELGKVLAESINFFKIDPVTTRLTVKDSMYKMILASKQFANFSGDWVLALYPNQQGMQPVLVNLQTGKWTDDLSSSFAIHSPAKKMLSDLKNFYGSDISKVRENGIIEG